MVDTGCGPGQMKDPVTGRCVDIPTAQDSTDVMNKAIQLNNFYKNTGYELNDQLPFDTILSDYLDFYNNGFKNYLNSGQSPFILTNDPNNPNEQVRHFDYPVTPQTYRKNPNPNKPHVI